MIIPLHQIYKVKPKTSLSHYLSVGLEHHIDVNPWSTGGLGSSL